MTVHDRLDPTDRERCALAACDLLSPAEAADFARHAEECALCRDEAAGLRAAAGELAATATAIDPPEGVWQRVAARLHRDERPAIQTWKRWAADAGGASGASGAAGAAADMLFRAASESDWEPTGATGVEARRLFVDPDADRVTMMVRMAAGTSWPAHIHAGPEECYVLAGDLRVGELHMHAGDFQRAEAGSRHGVQSTEGGCTLLLVSSLRDTLVA